MAPSSPSSVAPLPAVAALFRPWRLGALDLAHRVVLAPLTRLRSAQPGNIPHDLNATYYAQRASLGGLLISEATQVAPEGQGYPQSPGIHSEAQVEGWRRVTDAVHAQGGRIFLQLWHVGRISHPSFQPGGAAPIAPSAVRPAGRVMTAAFTYEDYVTPRALETHEIPGLVEAFRRGAAHAQAAGFDGVEIHAANGYLIDQFLRDRTNRRTDDYGGPVENRLRFLREVAEAVVGVWGADRVGVRFSPFGAFNDIADSDPVGLFTAALRALADVGLAYAHLVEPRQDIDFGENVGSWAQSRVGDVFRSAFSGSLIVAGGYDGPTAAAVIESGAADAVAFGRPFISNPDLPERLRRGAPLQPWNRDTFYAGDHRGYTDYPTLS